MKYKKTLIFVLATIAVVAALVGIWNWQKNINSEPSRQEQEIR